MTRSSSRRSSVAVRRTVLGLMLGIPLIGPPVLAQEAPPSDQPAEVEEMVEETVVEEPVLVQPVVEQPRVLISEVVIEGIEGHPEEERLQISTYDAMQVRPGMRVTREELQNDLNGIQATGWFSDVRIVPQNGPLGVQVIVQVAPSLRSVQWRSTPMTRIFCLMLWWKRRLRRTTAGRSTSTTCSSG